MATVVMALSSLVAAALAPGCDRVVNLTPFYDAQPDLDAHTRDGTFVLDGGPGDGLIVRDGGGPDDGDAVPGNGDAFPGDGNAAPDDGHTAPDDATPRAR